MRLSSIALLGANLLAVPAAAQAPSGGSDTGDTVRTRGFCLRARPAPGCRSFATIELMYERPVYSTKVPGWVDADGGPTDFGDHLLAAVGPMVNISERAAIGITAVFFLSNSERMSPGFEARYRRWQTPRTALDLSAGAGPMDIWEDVNTLVRGTGITLSAAVMHRELVGANVRLEWARGGGRSPAGVYFGGRVGSYLAPIGVVALVAAYLAAGTS